MIEFFFERVETTKVGEGIGFVLFHLATFDQFKHESSEVFRGLNAPLVEDGASHQTELFESQLSDSFEQLGAADVCLFFIIGLLSVNPPLRLMQSIEHKFISAPRILMPT